ncbi:MAG: tRNA (adenosine(37)-N6)-threonylcarbamoyltransferase complex ATPase subunit type 1 TsaE [Aquificae bacterium]|nr:tRNA (adenosine(37)-N6)-threonylcarbamoyltransferase complex ATPase subunit type 1 TsaE [Aquificota bacterium]
MTNNNHAPEKGGFLSFSIGSLEQLKELAEKVASCLKGNEVILLQGDLASGKTTFTRFLVSALDPSAGEDVSSPTFSIMNVYETENFPVYHIDLYRVKQFDISDFVGNGLIIIEWANRDTVEDNLPYLFISIDTKGDKRVFNITGSEKLIRCLKGYFPQ